jgi:short-subunit dehydrogenase
MKDKFILITGSARGLGKELALVFGRNNYKIILHDKIKKDLRQIEKELFQEKIDFVSVAGDLKSEKTLLKLYEVSKKKNVVLLINNAGIHCPKLSFEKLNKNQINDLLMVNLIAPIKLAFKLYSFFLKKRQGAIININSLSGLESQKFRTIYCASKWGLRGFSEALKLEARENKIRVIDIFPSRIKTRVDFKQGMETIFVAKKIFEIFEKTKKDKLILDDRFKK